MSKGKRLKKARALVDPTREYSVDEAVTLVKQTSTVKFDAAVEMHLRLGTDTKKAEHIVRASVVLPFSTGKKRRIAVFCSPEREQEAKTAGADLIGGAELVKKIQQTGKVDFDVAITTPDFMKAMATVARILGPKGLMPNPKSETITTNLSKAITELQKGKLTFRSDAQGIVHAAVGRVSMGDEELKANIGSFLDAVKKAKPQELKGTYLKSVTLASSMGPGIRVKI
ncbi:MAG: 50S ribosomal protein L1 [Actinobacteria bacterium]|nr:50S ribosomal protein L1 [Actinomycetota bacterium]